MLDLRAYTERPRLSDGVFGTEFQRLGLLQSSCAELVNLTSPAAVEQIARSYVEAGSDVLMTNTLSANRVSLAAFGAANKVRQIALAAVTASRAAAAATDVKVFGSFGPTGKIVMMEEISRDELRGAYAELAGALADGGAEAIVLETFNELADAQIALEAVKSVCDLPVIVSMAFAFGPDKSRTMMGETPEDLVQMATAHGAAGVGANCGVGPREYAAVAERLRAASDLPVWIKPNAGLPIVSEGKTVFSMPAEEFARHMRPIVAAGASFVGGCCGCGSAHIRAIRHMLD